MTGAFAAALARAAAVTPERLAVVDDARQITYGQLHREVGGIAARLRDGGVRPGDVVTSQLPNSIEAVALCLAANRIGATHNPVVTIYRDRELDFIRRQARSASFVATTDDDVLRTGIDTLVAPEVPGGPDAARWLLYTSGSTAEPKGVLHSDRTLGAECAAQAAFHRLHEGDVFVIPSPIGHISGLLYGILLPVWLGATSVLLASWDPERFRRLTAAHRGTFSGGAPIFLQDLLDQPGAADVDTSSLAVFPTGGANVPPELMRRATAELGVRTGRGYGSTEFPSITSSAGPGEEDDKRAETDGRPIGANQVRIVDGEIQARGPERFLGYLDASLDTEAFTEDGWFRTGDLGAIDEAGYLTVTGRRKDIIIRAGENLSARELEDLLAPHPMVAHVAVVARPDPRTGERACACIVARDPSRPPLLEELCEHLRQLGLSYRKLPEELVVLDELPRTPSGKVDKQALRARLDRVAP